MRIHTLAIDDGMEASTHIGRSEQELLEILRTNFIDPCDDGDIANEDIVQYLIDRQGLILYFGEHDLPDPKIEQLIVRDPDDETTIYTFVDGIENNGFITEEHIDPGAGYSRTEWDENTQAVEENESYSPAFKAFVVETRNEYADNEYIDQ